MRQPAIVSSWTATLQSDVCSRLNDVPSGQPTEPVRSRRGQGEGHALPLQTDVHTTPDTDQVARQMLAPPHDRHIPVEGKQDEVQLTSSQANIQSIWITL